MWSQPCIAKLNERAADKAEQKKLHREVQRAKSHNCEVCGWRGEDKKADFGYLWHDIFSNDPKGAIFLCEEHDGSTGLPMEGYFTCDECYKVFINNYTWENYFTNDDGDVICLPCAAKRYIARNINWVSTSGSEEVDIRKAPHVIGVDMPLPEGIKLFANAEFDSMDGRQISGDLIKEIIERAKDQGYTEVLPVLDAAYQFAVSIGIYVRTSEWVLRAA